MTGNGQRTLGPRPTNSGTSFSARWARRSLPACMSSERLRGGRSTVTTPISRVRNRFFGTRCCSGRMGRRQREELSAGARWPSYTRHRALERHRLRSATERRRRRSGRSGGPSSIPSIPAGVSADRKIAPIPRHIVAYAPPPTAPTFRNAQRCRSLSRRERSDVGVTSRARRSEDRAGPARFARPSWFQRDRGHALQGMMCP